jgi:hypothetical protein
MSPLIVLVWLVAAGLTAWVAKQKGRSVTEGVVLGLLIGLIGLVIELCLPAKQIG